MLKFETLEFYHFINSINRQHFQHEKLTDTA